jgi:hypothetical protein
MRGDPVTTMELSRFLEREAADVRVRQVQAEIFAKKLTIPEQKQDIGEYVEQLQDLHRWIEQLSSKFSGNART